MHGGIYLIMADCRRELVFYVFPLAFFKLMLNVVVHPKDHMKILPLLVTIYTISSNAVLVIYDIDR